MGELKVRDIMTTDVVTLKPENTVREATRKLAVENLTGAPVVDEKNRMIGILSQDDIIKLFLKYAKRVDEAGGIGSDLLVQYRDQSSDDQMVKDAVEIISNTKVEEIMTRTVLSTSADALVMQLLRAMEKLGVNRVPVLEKGVLLGIVSRGDVLFSIYKKRI